MKKIITILFAALTLFNTATAKIQNEKITYRVMYKWGLINKQAGTVTINTRLSSDNKTFDATLVGHSASWADKFYCVRDTLKGHIITDGIIPNLYEKISHEGGEYKRDLITYKREGNNVTAHCERWKQKGDEAMTHSTKSLSATGYTIDMISSFYHMRYMDFRSMKVGDSQTMNIFSGKRKEILKITFKGYSTVQVDDKYYQCYHITFSFTSDGKKKSSDDLQAWISNDSKRIPVKLEGKLPVGSVKCFFVP